MDFEAQERTPVTDAPSNVVPFAPRPKEAEEAPAPDLRILELRMDTDNLCIQLSVVSAAGKVSVIPFRVASLPDDLDPDDVVAAWEAQLHGAHAVRE